MKNLLLIPLFILLGLGIILGFHALTGLGLMLLAIMVALEIPAMLVAGGITTKAYQLYREKYNDTPDSDALWLPWALAAMSMVAAGASVGVLVLLGVFFLGLHLPNGAGGLIMAYSLVVMMVVTLIPAYQIAKRADWIKWLPPFIKRNGDKNGS